MLRGPPAAAARTSVQRPESEAAAAPAERRREIGDFTGGIERRAVVEAAHWVWFQALYISKPAIWKNRASFAPMGILLKNDRSQSFIPGPRNGRTAESIPMLPLAEGWKHEVSMNAIRLPGCQGRGSGCNSAPAAGDQPSDPVI